MDLFTRTMPADAYDYGTRSSGETHGVVLTKPHVVELILDLVGYTSDRDLATMPLLEPACGHGAFLKTVVTRLLESARRHHHPPEALTQSIRAFDIDEAHVEKSREVVAGALRDGGVSPALASSLSRSWISQGDFLLARLKPTFAFVVGNPPYIRIEQLSPILQREYRNLYRTLYDRADLYVAFIERSLDLLADSGRLSFICADRWILNRYGGPLRKKITTSFAMRSYFDLHSASPFDSDVIAYPSIFTVERGQPGAVGVGRIATGSPEEIDALRAQVTEGRLVRHEKWHRGTDPWIITTPEQVGTLRALEDRFRNLEDCGGTQVRIGVATGADDVFIVGSDLDVERDRLIPLVMRDDVEGGKIENAHRSVINTFDAHGHVIDLGAYPKLAAYFNENAKRLKARHVAKKNRAAWYRTIDRVYPDLVRSAKLLIPDIAGSNEVVFEEGRFHPHHNLYFVLSMGWDLEVLGGLLSSKVALFFVWSYAPKMRGGYLRFQAQYLRRIRTPDPSEIAPSLARDLKRAFRARDFGKLDALALRAYELTSLPAFDFTDTRT